MKTMKSMALIFIAASFSLGLKAAEKIKFNFKNRSLVDIIEVYSKASNTSFVMTSKSDLKISIFNPKKITTDEALEQITRALKQDGLSIVKMNDAMAIVKARHASRDNIPIYKKLPQRLYDHMATLVVELPKDKVQKVLKNFRSLSSKDGEIQAFENKLYITDFYSNLLRVEKLLKEIED